MSNVFRLPSNFIGRADRQKLESFGGHTVAHGRATRWHWDKDSEGNDLFAIYLGGEDERLAAVVIHDREQHAFLARDAGGNPVARGALDHVLAQLDEYLSRLHGEEPGA